MTEQKYPGLTYSTKLQQEAIAKHEFVVVRSKDSNGQSVKSKPSNRKVSGLPNFLLKPENSDIIYNFKYRITGNANDIRLAMKKAGFAESNIVDAIEGSMAVNVNNINDQRSLVMIQQEKELSKNAPETYDTNLKLSDLPMLGYKIGKTTTILPIKGTKVVASPSKQERSKSMSKSRGRRGGVVQGDLRKRAEQCGQNQKALNVTDLKEDMSGAKSCYIPSENAKSMIYLPEHHIVSSKETGVKMYFKLIQADPGTSAKALADWNRKSDAIKLRKESRTPRGKTGGAMALPAAVRKSKVRSPSPARSPVRSPRVATSLTPPPKITASGSSSSSSAAGRVNRRQILPM